LTLGSFTLVNIIHNLSYLSILNQELNNQFNIPPLSVQLKMQNEPGLISLRKMNDAFDQAKASYGCHTELKSSPGLFVSRLMLLPSEFIT
jgi:hypothetical protein